MSRDEPTYEELQEKLDISQAKLHNSKLERERLGRKLAKTLREQDDVQYKKDALVASVAASHLKIPAWKMPKAKKRRKRAWGVQMFSDQHFGEEQKATEVGGYNSYNDKVAEMRLKSTTIASINELKTYTGNIDYDGICLPFSGDVLTGEIHRELVVTNTDPVPETVRKWVPRVAASIQMFVDEFGDTPNGIFIPCVPGNHDRRQKTMEHKNAAMDSWSWVFYHWLASYFKDDPRVNFYIPEALDARFNLYDTRFLLTHGYGMAGGGAAGAVGAVMSDRQRLAIRDNVIGEDFDWLLCGHLHQTVFAQGAIMSGCMKGFDSYAYDIKCKPEPPSQALFLVTPENGVTKRIPIYCEAKGEREFWT